MWSFCSTLWHFVWTADRQRSFEVTLRCCSAPVLVPVPVFVSVSVSVPVALPGSEPEPLYFPLAARSCCALCPTSSFIADRDHVIPAHACAHSVKESSLAHSYCRSQCAPCPVTDGVRLQGIPCPFRSPFPSPSRSCACVRAPTQTRSQSQTQPQPKDRDRDRTRVKVRVKAVHWTKKNNIYNEEHLSS